MRALLLAVAALLTLPIAALGQTVALAGVLGGKALLIVNGGTPKGVAPGETFQEVKVISAERDAATVEIGGKRLVLRMGDSPASVGTRGGSANGKVIVLTGDSSGHFFSQGSINGHLMQFMVDTGASSVAFSIAEAERMRLDYKAGQSVRMSTANGMTQAWRIKLPSVRVAEVEVYDVEAVVIPSPMPFALLGNSFLTRFQMTRNNDQMILEKRP
jgi:aspartyl protease family protein